MEYSTRLNKGNYWWKRAVFYQIYPRSFMDSNDDGIGDLKGIISRLDYLNDNSPDSLGIDAIWFSPFFKSPDNDYGYDIADFCDVDPRFGTLEEFDQLLEEAHKRNIMVVLDLVVNHTSSEHPWFQESRSSLDNPRRNWYIWKDGRNNGKKPPNNWRNNFFGSAWSKDETTGQYYLHSFLREQPDLNWENSAVREAIADVIRFWLDRGVDGFRLDVAHIYCKDKQFRNNPPFYFPKKKSRGLRFIDRLMISNVMKLFSLPELQVRRYNQHQQETHNVLKGFRQIFDSYPAKTSIGEIVADDPALIASYYGQKNDELHMNFYFELLHCRFKARSFRRCIDLWEKALPEGAWPAYTLSNHDVTRAISRYNNDGQGDRKARLLMMLLLTLRGTPFIYYGEEVGMKEAKLSRKELKDPVGLKWYPFHRGRDGCRTPMQWNTDKNGGFTAAEPWLPVGPEHEKYNVRTQQNDPASLLNLTRRLITIRKNMPALLEGSYHSRVDQVPPDCLVYIRATERQRLLVILNFSADEKKVMIDHFSNKASLVASTNHGRTAGLTGPSILLGAYEGCLLEL